MRWMLVIYALHTQLPAATPVAYDSQDACERARQQVVLMHQDVRAECQEAKV